MIDAIVIGAGPAGLMAAEMLADKGHSVTVIEAKPSPARKLLMAGKSGLNLTKDEPFDVFLPQYHDAADWLRPMLESFPSTAVQAWAGDLGQEVFTGTSGRVFPKSMKSSPLLRALLTRLADKGVSLKTRWRWTGFDDKALTFDTPDGPPKPIAKSHSSGPGWRKLATLGIRRHLG